MALKSSRGRNSLFKKLGLLVLFLSLPFLTFLLVNKYYYHYWIKPNPEAAFKKIGAIERVEAYARVNNFTTENEEHYDSKGEIQSITNNFINADTFIYDFTGDNTTVSQQVKFGLDFRNQDSKSHLTLSYFDKNNLHPEKSRLLSEAELKTFYELFMDQSPQLKYDPQVMGELFLLKMQDGAVVQAWDLHSAIDDHKLNEMVFIRDKKIISSYSFYFDVAGLEGIEIGIPFSVFIIQVGAALAVLGVKWQRKYKIFGTIVLILGIGIFLFYGKTLISLLGWLFY